MTLITIANISRLYFTLGFAANLYGTENNFIRMLISLYLTKVPTAEWVVGKCFPPRRFSLKNSLIERATVIPATTPTTKRRSDVLFELNARFFFKR